jgi:hypothetical protein
MNFFRVFSADFKLPVSRPVCMNCVALSGQHLSVPFIPTEFIASLTSQNLDTQRLLINLTKNLSMALQSSVGPWPLFQFLDLLHSW